MFFHPGNRTADRTRPQCLTPNFLKMIDGDEVGTKTRKKKRNSIMCIFCRTIKNYQVSRTLCLILGSWNHYTPEKKQKAVPVFWQYLKYKPGLRHQHLGQQKLQQHYNFTKWGIATTHTSMPVFKEWWRFKQSLRHNPVPELLTMHRHDK